MSKGNTFENDLMKLIFNATAIANLADNAAVAPLTNLFVALHTADPGEAGDQTTSEATYTGYARATVARTSGGWTVAANQAQNAAAITFNLCLAGSSLVTYFSVGVALACASKILYSGPLGSILGAFVAENTDEQITLKGHGLLADDFVEFETTEGTALPAPIAQGTIYAVKTVIDADNFTISTSVGGGTLDITSDGAGLASKVTPLAITTGITPQFAAGALKVREN